MSVAVAVQKNRELVLATDTQSTFGTTRVPSNMNVSTKVRKIGSSYLATTGWGLYEDVLDDFLAKRKIRKLTDRKSIFHFYQKLWKDLHSVYSFVNDQCGNKDETPFGHLDSSFLVTNRNGIFYVAPDMSVTQFSRFFAIGSGGLYSLGALHGLYDGGKSARELAGKAVEAAIAFCAYCGGETQFCTVKTH
jgi:ATP-dependent protease HslVU (ClpYQ) peptidase subunit